MRVGLAAVAAMLIATPGLADDASPWMPDSYSKLRIISGSNANAAPALRAGIEVVLQPGWKTYWRYPGDSGVPPRFDFSGSSNVKSVKLMWPAPQRFSDGAGNSIGYHGEVIFPLHITPKDPAKPVLLKADVHYAVCEKLCVPAEGRAEIELGAGKSGKDAALTAAEARVPRPAKLGAHAPLAIDAIRRDDSGPRPRIIVEVTAPAAGKIDLLAEGPTAGLGAPTAGGTAQHDAGPARICVRPRRPAPRRQSGWRRTDLDADRPRPGDLGEDASRLIRTTR